MENSTQTPIEKPGSKPSPPTNWLSLSDVLLDLADVYKFPMTDRAMRAYCATVGHRTDEDLNRAYREILRNNKYMPSPAELLDACGILKVRRDGSKA